jgi:hypothetical protein
MLLGKRAEIRARFVDIPQGLKPDDFIALMYGLKPAPFTEVRFFAIFDAASGNPAAGLSRWETDFQVMPAANR